MALGPLACPNPRKPGRETVVYVVTVENKQLGELIVYGPFRSTVKAYALYDAMMNPFASEWLDPDRYRTRVRELQTYRP